MRKFLRKLPFKKVFVFLFIFLYTLYPPIQIIAAITLEDQISEIGTGQYRKDPGKAPGCEVKIEGGAKYNTIKDAIKNATSGNTILVKNKCIENIVINENITLKGENNKTSIIEPENSSMPTIKITVPKVTIENLRLTKAGQSGAIHVYNTKDITIQNNLFVNNRQEVWIDGSQQVRILKNFFTQDGNEDISTFGIQIINGKDDTSKENSNHRIEGNKFSKLKLATYAIGLARGTHNNIIVGNTIQGNITTFGAINLSNTNENRIEKNEIVDNNFYRFGTAMVYGTGISLAEATKNIIVGNIIKKHNTGIHLSNRSYANQIEQNTLQSNWHSIYFQDEDSINETVITENTIENNEIIPKQNVGEEDGSSGIHLNGGISLENREIKIYHNNFQNNKGLAIRYKSDQKLVADKNWWGHITGPSGESYQGKGDRITPNIVAQEWLCEPYETDWISEERVCKLPKPTQIGFNVNDGTPIGKTPTRYDCTEEYTNVNGVSIHWGDTANGDPNIIYERQYSKNGSNWSGSEIYLKPYTNYRSFGYGEVLHYSRVRAFYDTNGNKKYDQGEPVSDWSDTCSITYDKTPPEVPSGIYFEDLRNSRDVQCGEYSNTKNIKVYWDAIINDPTFSHFEYSSFNAPNDSPGLKEEKKSNNFFDCSGWEIPVEGEYGVEIRTVDKAENKSAWTDRCTINIDWTAPRSEFSTDLSNTYHNSPILLEGITTDENNVDYTELYFSKAGENKWESITKLGNSDKSSTFEWLFKWTPEEEGIYDIYASGTDLAGNEESSAFIYSITYDKTEPNISSLTLTNGILEQIEANDEISGVHSIKINIGDEEWEYTPGMNLNDKIGNIPGLYTVYIRVTDNAGNYKQIVQQFQIPSPNPLLYTILGEVLGAITNPISPKPVKATTKAAVTTLLAQTPEKEEDTEEIEESIDEAVEINEEKDKQLKTTWPVQEEEEEEQEGTKWWIYPTILLPLLFIFFLLYRRRKEEEVQY